MSKSVTIYAPTDHGVLMRDGFEPCGGGDYGHVDRGSWILASDIGRKFFLTYAEAAVRAEEMRARRISSLKSELAKLEASGPYDAIPQPKE